MIRRLLDLLFLRRAPKWPALEHAWKAEHPYCAACGGSEYVVVHHNEPVHINPARELDRTNLTSLCEKPSMNCHLWIGHLGNWKSFNANVIEDAAAFLTKIKNRPK